MTGDRLPDESAWRWRGLIRAERIAAPLRAVMVLATLIGWMVFPRAPGALPGVAWPLIVLATVRVASDLLLVYRWPRIAARAPKVLPLVDLAFPLAWIAVTGGRASPFSAIVFIGLVGPLRLPPKQALASLGVYVAAGLALLGTGRWLALVYLAVVGLGFYIWVLKSQNERWMADTDGLTGVFNHRYMKERLAAEIARAAERGGACGVLFVDLDGFKLFNDTYGHPAGDGALRTVAERLRRACPPTTVLGRFGGDEFALILPGADRDAVEDAGERLRAAVADLDVRPEGGVTIPVTASIGGALYPQDGTTVAEVLTAADKALYTSKRNGGNALAFANSEAHRLIAACGPTLGALESLAMAVEYKDHNTASHTEYVSRLCALVGERLHLSDEERRQLRIGAVLHDVGKIGIPEEILRKPGALTPDEMRIMRGHPELGYMILRAVDGLDHVLDIVLHHHERYDGTGYPHGLKGDAISLPARVVGVVDAFTAMTSDRPYRKGMPQEAAVAELRRNAGGQFDPVVVQALVDLLEAQGVAGQQ